jgi:radical SAM superfamily enzyme with C-terminal helix-hairpin-helix motif
MKRVTKVLLILAASCGVLLLGSSFLLAASIVQTGLVTVKVHESGPDGTHLYLPVPAVLVHAGMSVLPAVMDEDVWEDVRTDLGEWAPVAAEALRAVEDAPNAVLVEVENERESVRIEKAGRSLEIYVRDGKDTFEISLPASLLGRVAREIA